MITYALKKLLESRGLSSAGIKDIADAIERLTDDSYIRETLAKLIANLADGYSEEDTYPVGDYVFYEDVLYKCVEPVTEGEPFDSNKWVKTTIEEMFINADVSSAVAALANDIAPMYDPTHAYKLGDYVIYQFGLYQKASGSTVAENWTPSHWTPIRINEIIKRLREELSNDILNVKITYDPTTGRATSDVAGTVINNAITNGKTVAAYVNNVPAAVTKTGTGNSYILSFDAQRVSSYGDDEVVLEDILVRYINVTGQWGTIVTSKTVPLNGGESSGDSPNLVIELNYETEDPTERDDYRGEWDPTSNYNDGDIVHYSEDVTQKSNYYGEYDSSITSYDNIGYSEPIVYNPEDGLYYYVEWDGESSWLGDEYVPESGYFLVDATEETPKLRERYNVRSYYSTGVTKNQIREALKAGKSVIAVRYGDYDAGGFFSDEIYTLVNNSVVAEGEMTSRTSLTRFVGIEKQSGKTVFLESNLMDGDEELHLYQEEYDSDDDEEGGIVVIPLTFIGGKEEDVTAKENYKGEWDPSSTYDYDDIVHVSEDNGYYYVETTQVIDPETGEQVTTYTLGNEYSPEIIPQHYHMDYHPEQIIEDVKNGKVVVARHCYNDYETQVDTFILNHARTVTGGGEGDHDLLADIEFYAFEDSVSFIKLSYVGHYGSNWESDNDDYEGVDLDIYITHIAETSYTVTYSDSIAQTFDNYEDYAVGDLVVNYINDGNQYKLFRCTRAVTGDGTGFNENYWTEVQFNDAFVLKSDIAPFYDPNETYSSGDVVFFNNRLYKCNTTISTAEPFDNNKWDHTTLIDIEDDEDEPALKNIKDAENGGIIEGIVDHNIASGKYSHAEGGVSEYDDIYDEYTYEYTTASGEGSHAEGSKTTASGKGSHAEGEITKATNKYSHSEGRLTTAGGMYSHAEGDSSNAQGSCSHAEGVGTLAYSAYQHVLGSYNVGDPSGPSSYAYRGTYVEIVGNGLVESSRSNARTLDWSGNESLAGGLTLGKGTADEVTITAAQLKALLALLNT